MGALYFENEQSLGDPFSYIGTFIWFFSFIGGIGWLISESIYNKRSKIKSNNKIKKYIALIFRYFAKYYKDNMGN